MYCDGRLFRLQGRNLERLTRAFGYIFLWIGMPCLLLARRQALPRLHPLEQSSLAVADRSTNPDVRRAVAAHARLGKPGDAHLEKLGRLLGREQDKGWRRMPLERNVLV